jgi:YYY domain-containing protein
MEVGVIAIWLLACGALSAVGWPLAAALFGRMPDRGAALALPVALVVLTVVAYWIGHLSIVLGLLAGVLVLLVASALALRSRFVGDEREEGLRVALRGVWLDDLPVGPAAESAAVFLLAFSLLIAIRAVDPAVHPGGGEKFLDFGLLASLLRASALPPEDMWFAGEPVQYYYGGHLMTSLLARLTGIPPRYAYNLGLATFYALLVTVAYGLAGAIAAGGDASRQAGGALGAFFSGLAANLVTALYVLLWVLPASVAGSIADATAGRSALSAAALTRPLGEYSYWTASRVIEGTVNEFPLFAWLNGDLHAHMMSTPFLLLVAAIGYAYARTPATDRRRRRWLLFGALPPLVGLLAVVNTWSLPTAVGLTWLALVFASAHPATLLPSPASDRLLVVEGSTAVRELARTGAALAGAFTVLLGALAWSFPFWFESASGRGIAFMPDRTGPTPFLLIYGAFLAVFLLYLFDRARPSLGDRLRAGIALLLVLCLALAGGFAVLGVFGPLLVVAWLLLRGQDVVPGRFSREHAKRLVTSGGYDRGTVSDRGEGDEKGERIDAAGGIGDGGTADSTEMADSAGATDNTDNTDNTDSADSADSAGIAGSARTADDTDTGSVSGRSALGDVGYETVLVVAGIGLVVLVEFAYVDAQAGPGRYNTVFKTYMQVWVLFAVAVGVILARFLASKMVRSGGVGDDVGLGRRGASALIAVLVLSTSLYAGIALGDHFADPEIAGSDGPTIDALAFASATHPGEAPAIRWLDRETSGRQPTIVSAPGVDTYSWTNAPSSLTGVPTVAGWSHEVGYRGLAVYRDRVADVDRIYTETPSQQARLLREYDVRYVYVGPVERERYGPELGFEGLRGLDIAFRNDAVTIYAVDRDRLGSRSADSRRPRNPENPKTVRPPLPFPFSTAVASVLAPEGFASARAHDTVDIAART